MPANDLNELKREDKLAKEQVTNFQELESAIVASLQRLRFLSTIEPSPSNQVFELEESALVGRIELLVRQAIKTPAKTTEQILQKLNIWKIDNIYKDGEADNYSDNLILSVIKDVRLMSRYQGN